MLGKVADFKLRSSFYHYCFEISDVQKWEGSTWGNNIMYDIRIMWSIQIHVYTSVQSLKLKHHIKVGKFVHIVWSKLMDMINHIFPVIPSLKHKYVVASRLDYHCHLLTPQSYSAGTIIKCYLSSSAFPYGCRRLYRKFRFTSSWARAMQCCTVLTNMTTWWRQKHNHVDIIHVLQP